MVVQSAMAGMPAVRCAGVAEKSDGVGVPVVAAGVPAGSSAGGVPLLTAVPRNRDRLTLLRAECGPLLGVAWESTCGK